MTNTKYYLYLDKYDNGQYSFKISDSFGNLLHSSSSYDLASLIREIHNYNYNYELIDGENVILQDVFALLAEMSNKDYCTKYDTEKIEAYYSLMNYL
jgi:hypothetical protein